MFAQVYRKCVNHECFLDDTYLLKVNTPKTPKLKKLHLQPVTKSKYLNNPNVLILKFHLEVNAVCFFMLESTHVDSVIPVIFLVSSVQATQCLRSVIYCLPQSHASTFLDWCSALWMPRCWEHCSQQALVRYWKTQPGSNSRVLNQIYFFPHSLRQYFGMTCHFSLSSVSCSWSSVSPCTSQKITASELFSALIT